MAKQIIVEKSIEIGRPKSEIYNFLKICRNQESFSVWNMADPDKNTTSAGKDGVEGFIYSWDSQVKNVGAGTQEIIKLVDGESIEYELRFERPMKNIGSSKFILSAINDTKTLVTWDFRGPTKFPMSLFKGMFQNMLGKDLSKSLENLKELLEK